MAVKTICISHSPLISYKTDSPKAQLAKAELDFALGEIRKEIEDFRPNRVVMFAPDHITGLHMDVLPQFCVIGKGSSVNDFGGFKGVLPSREETAIDLVTSTAESGVDLAISMDGKVDHGVTQPLAYLFEGMPDVELIPILVNCHLQPITPVARSISLGRAVGKYLSEQDGRTLIIGSGGLCHDPQFPQYDDSNPVIRQFVTRGRRLGRVANSLFLGIVKVITVSFGKKYREGIKGVQKLNPVWDESILEALEQGDFESMASWTFESIIAEGGGTGGQEIRTWLAALSAHKAIDKNALGRTRFYQAVPEWGIGCAVFEV